MGSAVGSGAQSVGFVAADGDAMPEPRVGVVIPQRLVHHAAVVPECNRVRLPLEAHAELGRFHMPIEHFENGIALAPPEADNTCGVVSVDEQGFSPRHRMCPNNGVFGPRKYLAAVVDTIAPTHDVLAIMYSAQSAQQLLDRFRKRLVGQVHVGEQGVPATVRGNLGNVQDRAHWWLWVAGHIGMPFLAGNTVGFLVSSDDEDFRMILPGRDNLHLT